MASREQISPPDAYVATQEYDTILFKELISAVGRQLPDKTAPQQLPENNASQDDDDVTKLKESQNCIRQIHKWQCCSRGG